VPPIEKNNSSIPNKLVNKLQSRIDSLLKEKPVIAVPRLR